MLRTLRRAVCPVKSLKCGQDAHAADFVAVLMDMVHPSGHIYLLVDPSPYVANLPGSDAFTA